VFDLSKLAKFARKEYRDSYLQTQVRGGIAYQMQALREKFGLSQTAFAEKTGKKQSVISRLENTEYGRASIQTLLDIACSLDVALLVKFVSYPDFLAQTRDMTTLSLQPETIYETLSHTMQVTFDQSQPSTISTSASTSTASRFSLKITRSPFGVPPETEARAA